jgi:hypothetical protein
MAILTTRTDTETNECTVEVNGVPMVMPLDSVSIYNFGSSERPKYTFSLCMCDPDSTVRVNVSASRTEDASTSSLAPDLYETRTVLASPISAWFESKRSR